MYFIILIEKVIEGKDGAPKILTETVNAVPQVITVKLDTEDSAEFFVLQHARSKSHFAHLFNNCLGNINQSPE